MSTIDTSRDLNIPLHDRQKPCDRCHQSAWFDRGCGAWVCNNRHHVGLARCFCGWAASGGNGRQELVDMGETIGDEYPGGL